MTEIGEGRGVGGDTGTRRSPETQEIHRDTKRHRDTERDRGERERAGSRGGLKGRKRP